MLDARAAPAGAAEWRGMVPLHYLGLNRKALQSQTVRMKFLAQLCVPGAAHFSSSIAHQCTLSKLVQRPFALT